MVEEMPEERMRLIKIVWQRLQDVGSEMNILHYNALLRVFVDNEYNFTPSNFLETIKSAGFEPNM